MPLGLLLLVAMFFASSVGVTAASPAYNSSAVVVRPATSYFTYNQTRGICDYHYHYQRSKSSIDLYYNDGDVYALRIIQYLQYRNSRGRWVTAKSASKTGYVYGGTGYMSLSKTFRWSNRTLRTRDTRVKTQFRLYRYSGGYDYVNMASNYCG